MSGYQKEIKEIMDSKFKPVNDVLINRGCEFMDSSDDSVSSPMYTTPARSQRYQRHQTQHPEELRLLKLVDGDNGDIKTKILESGHSDMVRAKCLQMLREYNDDPENNSTAITALQMILKLPVTCKDIPISIDKGYDQVSKFLENAWNHMCEHVYGQERAKSEIIEYLVSNLVTTKKQPRILGLVGPPGVGKTSLALHGIAKVIGLPFYQISVGGLRDVTYFSGSMRCWKGAHQGKFTDIQIKTGCLNQIIYIDELDKVAADTAQDIYGLLTHVADAETNKHIQDHYLGIDLDMSNVTFIFSYNDPNVLPAPLRDRIKEIYFDGFNHEEKVDIARDFIIPRLLKGYNLSPDQIQFSDDVIMYANKTMQVLQSDVSGVRYLNKGYQSLIDKIMVNLVCNQASYDLLHPPTASATIKPKLNHKKTKLKSKTKSKLRRPKPAPKPNVVNFIPYYKNITLPYTVTMPDIDYYLSSTK